MVRASSHLHVQKDSTPPQPPPYSKLSRATALGDSFFSSRTQAWPPALSYYDSWDLQVSLPTPQVNHTPGY